MHILQEKLLGVIDNKNIGGYTLRDIGKLVDEKLPQKVKHHLLHLERKGFIFIDKKNRKITRINNKSKTDDLLVSIPIVGSASCGPATIFADQNIEGYLKISKRFIPNSQNTFAIRAEGNSMNKASIKGKNIVPGDYIIVDSSNKQPHNDDYIVAILDEKAIIKKYRLDTENSRIALISESTQDYAPIFIHEDDDFNINGKVLDVIKNIK